MVLAPKPISPERVAQNLNAANPIRLEPPGFIDNNNDGVDDVDGARSTTVALKSDIHWLRQFSAKVASSNSLSLPQLRDYPWYRVDDSYRKEKQAEFHFFTFDGKSPIRFHDLANSPDLRKAHANVARDEYQEWLVLHFDEKSSEGKDVVMVIAAPQIATGGISPLNARFRIGDLTGTVVGSFGHQQQEAMNSVSNTADGVTGIGLLEWLATEARGGYGFFLAGRFLDSITPGYDDYKEAARQNPIAAEPMNGGQKLILSGLEPKATKRK